MTPSPTVAPTAFLSIPEITLRWVLRLRWGAVAGQAATIAATAIGFGLALPLGPLGAVLAFTALSNVALHRWARPPRAVTARLVAGVLGVDSLSLCALLYFTGGPSNPFSVLFLVQITIAALVLGMRYTAAIVALSTASYAFLFFANVPLAGMEHMHHAGSGAFNLHLQGMFVAFALAAVLIAYFVTRVSVALRERDAQLAQARRAAEANERLASLSTLAAGAAHELGTPLGTIAVASKELERAAASLAGADDLRDDARLIRQEVERCRVIVEQMSARSAGARGEVAERVPVETLVSEVRARMGESRAARLDVRAQEVATLEVPWRGLAQVLVSLVKNAFDASDPQARVELAIEASAGRARFTVTDRGSGIAEGELAHVGEPFFTTKAPGAGMGLGVFLARAFADRLGGGLTLTSRAGEGTRAVLELPAEGG